MGGGDVMGKTPDIHVLLEDDPSQGGIMRCCLAEQLVILQAVGRWVLSKRHCYHGLVFGQLEGQPWVRSQVCAQVAIPRLSPGCEIGHTVCGPLVPGSEPSGGQAMTGRVCHPCCAVRFIVAND